MSTYMAKPNEVERKWYVVDAAGKPLGRLAVEVADLLRGKNKPTFTPHVDCGDFVIVTNIEKAVLTGKKAEQKFYYHHTGYIGHLKETRYDTLMATKPTKAMELAVKGMLPKNTLGRNALLRLRLFEGAEHNHQVGGCEQREEHGTQAVRQLSFYVLFRFQIVRLVFSGAPRVCPVALGTWPRCVAPRCNSPVSESFTTPAVNPAAELPFPLV